MCSFVWCSDGGTSTFALSPSGLRCKSAKMRKREVAKAKDRKCEDATRRCEGEVAKAKMRYFYRSFALASLYSRPKWSHRNTILMSTWSKIEILSSYNLQPYSDSLVSSSSGIMNYWIIYDHINIADSYVRNEKYHDANL